MSEREHIPEQIPTEEIIAKHARLFVEEFRGLKEPEARRRRIDIIIRDLEELAAGRARDIRELYPGWHENDFTTMISRIVEIALEEK